MHKIIFTVPAEPSRFTNSIVTLRGYKAGMVTLAQPTSSQMISHRSSASFPTAEVREGNRAIDMKETREGC
jgi:hypothetical protein